jgi:rubrerythrin
MPYLPSLEELDKDGAIQEAAERLDGETRATFLRKAGIGAGAIIAGGAFAGGLPALARGQAIPQSDIDILNFALTLEELEAAFYQQAVQGAVLRGETRDFALVVRNHEVAHVQFLRKALGAKAVAKPTFDFKDTTTNQTKFEDTAKALEDTGVHAYLGQLANIRSKAILAAAGRILPVEARHAAWIRSIRQDDDPAPAAFEDPFPKSRILRILRQSRFIVSG